jgi:hypothetical protein
MSNTGLLQQVAQQDVPDDNEIQGGLMGALGRNESSFKATEYELYDEVTQPKQPLGLLELLAKKGVGK